MKPFHSMLLAAGLMVSSIAYAADTPMAAASSTAFTVKVDGITHGQPMGDDLALCNPTKDGKSDKIGNNIQPAIVWSNAPKGTASFAIFMMDPDVPADFSDANKEGKVIAEKAKRKDFFHYGVVNIPAMASMHAGSMSDKYVEEEQGMKLVNDLGLNDYVNPSTAYGGPCPPWNDARLHHYHFIVLALDKDADSVINAAPATDCNDPACKADTAKNTFDRLITSKHVLGKATVIGTYTLNKELRSK